MQPFYKKFIPSLLTAICLLCQPKTAASQSDFWQQTTGPFSGTVNAIVFDGNNDLLAAADEGVYRSTDSGRSWQKSGLEHRGEIESIAMNSQGHIFAATGGSGVYYSIKNGESWAKRGLGESTVHALAINANDVIFAGTENARIYRSRDDGRTWQQVEICQTIRKDPCAVHSLAINDSGQVFAATWGGYVLRSNDNGDTWQVLDNGLVTNILTSLAINSVGHIFTACAVNGMFRSTDNGETWTSLGYATTPITAIATDASNRLYAGLKDGGLLRSTDNGDTWEEFALQGITVRSLQFLADGNMLAGTNGGVFRFTGVPHNWQPVNSGLTENLVYTLATGADGHLYAGTGQGGVFRSIQLATAVQERAGNSPTRFSLSQNYPNPFNPGTRIRYSVASDQFVSLKIYDIFGREVATLVNGVASGVYFYRLQAGSFVETKKLLLIR